MPVTLPPGRLRLVTRPNVTGSPALAKTIGMVDVAAFAARPDLKVKRGWGGGRYPLVRARTSTTAQAPQTVQFRIIGATRNASKFCYHFNRSSPELGRYWSFYVQSACCSPLAAFAAARRLRMYSRALARRSGLLLGLRFYAG